MKEISWAACLRLGVTAAAVYLICAGRETLSAVLHAFMPLLLGGGIACVINIPMAALERRFFPRGGRLARLLCLAGAVGGLLLVSAWLAAAILPELIECVSLLAETMPQLLSVLSRWADASGAEAWLRTAGLADWQSLLQRGVTMVLNGGGDALRTAGGLLASLASGALDAVVAMVFALYLLLDKERLLRQVGCLVRRMLGDAAHAWLKRAAKALRDALGTYARGQCLEAVVLGCLCLLGMLLLRLPGALMLSALAGVSALIPMVGALLAAAAGAVLLLPAGPVKAVTFAVFFVILQQMESNFICPHIVGASLGLSPAWMLAAMAAGAGLFGIPGALLAVPVAAACKTLLTSDQ